MQVTWTLEGEGYQGVALPELKRIDSQKAAEMGLIPGYYFDVIDPVAVVHHVMRWDTVQLWGRGLKH